ncbi:hypothetical protein CFOL_v3_34681, partial [Cephalotus follicularis]
QEFYEFILVDTDSIKITPKSDPNNPELITHTSVFGQKIMNIAEWGQPPHKYKQFSSSFDISVYNYFDYIQAWKHVFLFQNIEDKHSWFFCFDKIFNTKQIIPYWFMDWWTFYGPNQDILPLSVEEALYTFANNTDDGPFCPIMASFFIHCKLSWIMCWDYTIEEAPRTLPTIHRQSWTKWWNKY